MAESDSFLAGRLLVAMPGIGDPRFERSVVFLCAHDAQHAMGLAVNRLAQVEGLLTDGDRLQVLSLPAQPLGLAVQPVRLPDTAVLSVEFRRGLVVAVQADVLRGHPAAQRDGELAWGSPIWVELKK